MATDTVKIGVCGCVGRMGQMVSHAVLQHPNATLSAGTALPDSEWIGKSISEAIGVKGTDGLVTDSIESLLDASDAIIDFTSPEYTLKLAEAAAKAGKVHVIGTTGLNKEQEAKLAEFAQKTAIVYAANMSVGVNMLLGLAKKVAASLDTDFDIEIVEMHHKHKVDAPSGTALALGKAVAEGRKTDLDTSGVFTRHGNTGERKEGDIGFATLRGGSVIGDHTVIFAGDNERVELTHKAEDRSIFAKGAVRAAVWAKGKPAGLYSMQDVLGLND